MNSGSMAAMAAALAANSTMSSDKTEMRVYLDRLKAMVPQCPKNRKVSRQELLEHVINYISDLEDTLQSDSESDSPPASPTSNFSFSDSFNQYSQNQQSQLSGYNQQSQLSGYNQQSQLSGYTQESHLSGYSQQPQFGESFKQQPQYDGYGTQTHQYSQQQYSQENCMMMEDSHGSSDYSKYYGSSSANYPLGHSTQSMEMDTYGFGY
ncbi:uncharacterized protein LOC125028640 [Penaeus chinensis]|uniref:uncharacterized protein LOC125028640 n=1 Tax=Penaeus chinensis TaxID=139456 RepID=UPI001FB84EC9|nr:uncharacterized protein LOC125028640 [Penaeus chinensis]